MLLLFVLTHAGNNTDSSILVMAFSVGNIMLNIGKFGVRQFQVTDAQEDFSFQEYTDSRLFSLFIMVFASVLYLIWGVVGNDYSIQKTIVIASFCIYKGIEAAEDVIHGRLQQKGRLDIAGKILAVRIFVFLLGYTVCYCLTHNIVLTTLINTAFSLVLSIVMNRSVIRDYASVDNRREKRGIPWKLIAQCFPLCLCMVMNIYLGNAPKYIIDGIVTDNIQTCFNIVFMPALVVALLAGFIFNPVLKKIGFMWTEEQFQELKRLTRKLTFVPVLIDIAVVLLGLWLGLPVLGFVYGVDISAFRAELIVSLIASGVMAMLNLYVALLTTMRKQVHLLVFYGAGSAFLLTFGRYVLRNRGLLSLCRLYLIVMCIVTLCCMIVYAFTLRNKLKVQKHETP